ncbi:SRPBCC family protein [Methylophaga pinxianii]|uniref:SRPBCC family protein n=1 Tax=Methylophaga pinxianii TaxID=2881052 RepID=UPI001CF3DB5F|nr:SRPBCC family protein [Methylophaga pinxianii]MCB2426408.1 SRPBCC family protein [Methylophaga pinxianii]UPH45776.1 SRPBCC family protein [Methylophaga pinxianii]
MNKIIKKLSLASLGLIVMSSSVFAHGPTPQRVDEHIIIEADVAAVWQQVNAFDQLDKWHPAVESIQMQDDTTRVVKLKTGGEITESLDESDAERHYVGYRLLTENIEAMPVSFYTIGIEVEADAKGSKVSWSGRFYRADTGNFPPENLNDEAAVKAMTDYAKSGLEGLKASLEK